jgi:hypothetical protein
MTTALGTPWPMTHDHQWKHSLTWFIHWICARLRGAFYHLPAIISPAKSMRPFSSTALDRKVSLSPAQGGFCPWVRPQETVYCLMALLHHRKAKKQPSYMAFVDFETTFQSTFKPVVWTCMFDLGSPPYALENLCGSPACSQITLPDCLPG